MDYLNLGVEYIENVFETRRLAKTTVKSYGLYQEHRETPIVISLTSFPGRISSVSECVKTLLNQTIKPDKVVLWLAESQFPGNSRDLPQNLLDLQNYGLEIRWCKDLRSYKKLIPSLIEFSSSIIITCDDDQYYEEDWLKRLIDGYIQFPNCIQCHIVTALVVDNNDWKLIAGGRNYYTKPSYLNKLVGCGGVLYPPNVLHSDCCNEKLFMRLAPTNDDLWFWLMGVLKGTKVNVVKHPIIWNKSIKGTSKSALSNINKNEIVMGQFKNILDYYPDLKHTLKEEFKLYDK